MSNSTNTNNQITNGNSNAKPDGSSDTNNEIPLVDWTIDHEDILIEWADKAMCFRWLHSRAHALYNKLNYNYTIPVIVISTLTGTANFAQDRVPLEYQGLFVMIVGGFNILAGIITTIQQFLKITQLNEAHRVSGIAWDKFYRNIKIELARHPDERMHVNQMLKMCKEEFDRMMETSPNIPDEIINEFKNKFKDSIEYEDIIKPEICDKLMSTESFRNQWSSQENLTKKKNLKAHRDTKMKLYVTNFISEFQTVQGRDPIQSEIIDNLKDKIDTTTLTTIINDINNSNTTNSNSNSNSNSNLNSNSSLVIHASNVANLPV
jgi:arsenate reductase-like glutaredoxin family protein